MPEHEGFVASLTADGKADVVIRPGKPGIPGAPELSNKVCHSPTDGSSLKIQAVNRAGAGVGDWVSLSRKSGTVMKNAAVLLGIPVLGGILGFTASTVFTSGFAVYVTSAVVSTAVGLVLGIIIGVASYRRVSADSEPVISRIIKSRMELASLFKGNQSRLQNEDGSCDSCSRCFPLDRL